MQRYGATIGCECNYLADHIPDCTELKYLTIGDYVTISNDVRLLFHDGSIGPLINRNPVFRGRYKVFKQGKISIGNHVFIGVSTVLMPVSIGDYAVIGAGSIVTKNVPDFELWAGVPARFIKPTSEYIAELFHNNEIVISADAIDELIRHDSSSW